VAGIETYTADSAGGCLCEHAAQLIKIISQISGTGPGKSRYDRIHSWTLIAWCAAAIADGEIYAL
jgi:hypothetical protein